MLGWIKRLFEKRKPQTNPIADTEPPPADIVRLAAERDYRPPPASPYSDHDEAGMYLKAHRSDWEFFVQGSFSYLGPDGRAAGVILGRGACERKFGSEPEPVGFTAGFDQAMKQHFQRVREAIQAHFAGAGGQAKQDAATDTGRHTGFL